MRLEETKGHVASHRQPAEHDRLADLQGVEHGGQIVGPLLDGHLSRRDRTAAEAAEIGGDDAVMRGERLDLLGPNRMIHGKTVDQHHGAAGAVVGQRKVNTGKFDRGHGRG